MKTKHALTAGAAAVVVGAAAVVAVAADGGPERAAPVASVVGPAHKPAKPGDLNGDGRRDLILPSPDGRVGAARGFFTVVQSGPGGPGPGPVANRRLVTPASVGLPVPTDQMNGFGGVAASADFDRDGYADLATDTSLAPVSSNKGRPIVIVYGGPGGLTKRKVVLQTPDGFGAGSLAVGDFDGNGVPDLVAMTSLEFSYLTFANIGNRPVPGVKTTFAHSKQEAPFAKPAVADFNHDGRSDLVLAAEEWEDEGPRVRGWGELHLGTAKGLAPRGTVFGRGWTFGHGGVAAGDVNGDGRADLVVARYVKKGPGAFSVLLGTKQGLGAPRTFSQSTPGVPDSGQARGYFGQAIAVGDVNGDHRADVAVGAPGQKVGRAAAAGTVTLLYGTKGGLTGKGARLFTQNTKGVPGTAEYYDEFGYQVSLADLTGDGKADLTVGVHGENTGNQDEAGWVYFFPGSRSGPTLRGLRYFGPAQLKIAHRDATPGAVLLP